MTDLIQKLPLELLAEILKYTSVPDILKVKQVNRTFRDAILASPLILHKIDLHSTGLEYNTAARTSLADSKKALLQYRTNLSSLRPSGKRSVVMQVYKGCVGMTGGVYGMVEDSIRLFTLGSASRGIPCKEWEISSPVNDVEGYCFYPGADVIAFLDVLQRQRNFQVKIHLRTLSDGSYHPAARRRTIRYSRSGVALHDIISISMSSSKLVVLSEVQPGKDSSEISGLTRYLIVWDWKNARLLFELEEERYNTVAFIDDNRLLVGLWSTRHTPPSLVLVDAGECVGETPMQTFLHLSPSFTDCWDFSFHLEQGVHAPSPEESLAPFHQDPMQRIVVLEIGRCSHYLVLKVETLLELVANCAGSKIGWDEWRDYVVIAPSGPDFAGIWVSGCRLFCICEGDSGQDPQMKVYDFSAQGLARHLLSEKAGVDRDPTLKAAFPSGARCLSFTEARTPFSWDGVQDPCFGQDNFVFYRRIEYHLVLHIWAFS